MKGKVAVMTEPEQMIFEEYELPKAAKDSILVRVRRTNVCGSELHIWKGLHPTKKSGVMGHEMVGEIVELGEGVITDYAGQPVRVGDRIAAAYFLTCKRCKNCLQGYANLCENAYEYWSKEAHEYPHFHGSFATHYYIHPNQYFYKVPDNVPDEVAAGANCALSQVYFGIEKSGLKYGDTVVIQGAGGLGLNATAVAKMFGAKVIVIDTVPNRLALAKRFGADEIISMDKYKTVEERVEKILSLTNGVGADVVMELTGVPAALSEGIHLIKSGGKYVSIGNISPGKLTEFDPGLMTRKNISILGLIRYEPWYLYKSLKFLSSNIDKYPFSEILACDFTLEDLSKALDASFNRGVTRASIEIEHNN
ncbi:zinc-binding dehydrogenase [Psychrobacillus sp. NEAU-3TGS]|uniref:zinc-binding dehydrogenase n=1 Tax=Psychrobacillus sp. NEAU-3TGS TaxID=2995412 RepID=UPI002496450C|nr:zinc-binding dehydrogenase [Psychrobacillus sp. NEAU-3TGS]MDI2588289.1 zinc-binding dehydrogenase [Psychrobacillus sp. NEAU-3TGS]